MLISYVDRRTLISFAWFFFLLFGWYCARPVRESLATMVPESQLKWVMSATFALMLIVTPIYGWIARQLTRRTLYLMSYSIFLIAFSWFAWSLPTDAAQAEQSTLLIGCFYVWASFFSLFSVSCFWSFLVDVFTTGEAKVTFGRIAAGGTAGSILASLVAINLSKQIGNRGLLMVTAGSLMISAILVLLLDIVCEPARWTRTDVVRANSSWRDLFTAFRSLTTSPYLLGIAIFLFVGTAIDIVLYFDVNSLMKGISDVHRRTSLFASFNLYSSIAIVAGQWLITPWCLRHLGITYILVGVPLVYAISFGTLGMFNTLAVAFSVGILIRVLWLSLVAPAREVLFTSVSREDKFATKNLIDTVFVRGGGVFPGFLIEPGKAWLGSMDRVLFAAIPFALLAAGLGAYLGRLHRQSLHQSHDNSRGPSSP
ncbi:MFS transporter [bacterium]|nr:MFS transporter [bacterium]